MERARSTALDAMLGHTYRVLDDGFVRVLDYMGDDAAVVQAARISYGTGTKQVQEDRGLIRYLVRHAHTTPLEMCEIKFHVRVPMDIWRQWVRHRTASVNEYSTRYSIAIDAIRATEPHEWRSQSNQNRQGSGGLLPLAKGQSLSKIEGDLHATAKRVYRDRIAAGVAREQARKDLPLSTYTEAYWKIDLHNLLHFLRLRMQDHAQAEIRAFATVIGERIVSQWVPDVWSAFEDYQRNAIKLSSLDREVVAALVQGRTGDAVRALRDAGLLASDDGLTLRRNRERSELEEKLRSFGLSIPWTTPRFLLGQDEPGLAPPSDSE